MNRRLRMMMTAAMQGAGAGAAPFVGPFDDLAVSSTGAYALRRLYSAYTGDCLTLRRSSDDAESDFGFDSNGDLDTAAITTWLGGANGFVKTLYDQSGNARNATQTTNDKQPQLVLNVVNSRPIMRFDGTDDNLPLPVTTVPDEDDFTVSVVNAADNNTGLRTSFSMNANDGANSRIYLGNSATDIYSRVGGNPGSADMETSTLTFTEFFVHTIDGSGGIGSSWIDGGSAEQDPSFNNTGVEDVRIGAFFGVVAAGEGLWYDGDIAEVVIFPSLAVDDRTALVADQGDAFGITVT